MEVQIKKAVKAGNSSAVILPRAWLNKDIRVELVKKTPEIILEETIRIIRKYIDLKKVIGIYLTGSYARGEESKESDIDILVITVNIDREMIKEGAYNILLVSEELLRQKLREDLLPIGPMIKEAKPLLNSRYLDTIEIKITNKNVKWYLDTTKDKLRIIKKIIGKNKKINDRVAYTLVLRIRTLYVIKKLAENKDYSKREFIRLIRGISGGESAYESYLDVKNDLEDKRRTSLDESKRLYRYLKRQLEEVRKKLRG